MNNLMKKIITEKIEWLREHGVLCYVGDLDSATPAEIDKLCEAIENMTAQVVEREGESEPWECGCDCCDCCEDNDDNDDDYEDDDDDDDEGLTLKELYNSLCGKNTLKASDVDDTMAEFIKVLRAYFED